MLVDDAGVSSLATSRFSRLVQLGETTSTNAIALERARAGEPEGLVVVADHQTEGRGRFDRRWESPPGASLLFSVLMRPPAPELPVNRRHLAVAALSLAVADAAHTVAGVQLQLKWPNDLVGEDAKVAGLLAETAGGAAGSGGPGGPGGPGGDALVVGAGVNVAWAPDGLGATCLQELAGREVDRGELLVATLLALDGLYGRWEQVSRRYQAESATVGRDVVVKQAGGLPDVEGTAVAVDEDGHLVVRRHGPYAYAPIDVHVAAGDVVHASATRPPSNL